jgi:hypothetical protein
MTNGNDHRKKVPGVIAGRAGRRAFLQGMAALAGQALLLGGTAGLARAFGSMRQEGRPLFNTFRFAQLRYRGGDWNPDPGAVTSLSDALVRRTSIASASSRFDLDILAPDLFEFPLLYMTGHYDFEPFTDEEVRRLREHLDYGGLLVLDDCAGHPGFDFDRAVRREIGRIYAGQELVKLPRDHAVLRSYYLLRTLGGRRIVSPYLEGIVAGGRTTVIYCQNDFGCALERDDAGGWLHPCLPGGERQRQQAFQLAVNIVMYALCQDYKNDRIHQPFIRERI